MEFILELFSNMFGLDDDDQSPVQDNYTSSVDNLDSADLDNNADLSLDEAGNLFSVVCFH